MAWYNKCLLTLLERRRPSHSDWGGKWQCKENKSVKQTWTMMTTMRRILTRLMSGDEKANYADNDDDAVDALGVKLEEALREGSREKKKTGLCGLRTSKSAILF